MFLFIFDLKMDYRIDAIKLITLIEKLSNGWIATRMFHST